MSKKVALVLAGCGFMDGAEINEAVISLLVLSQEGAEVSIFAPSSDFAVVDHLKGEAAGETRNVLVESARIARGKIADLKEAKAEDFDALIIPGGYGAAKNLSSFATDGPECSIDEHANDLIKAFHAAGKPVAAVCIAPALLAKSLGEHRPRLTIGNDAGTASALEALGAQHRECLVTDIVVDQDAKVVTTPAFMYDPTLADVYTGIQKCVVSMLAMA